MEKNTYTHYIGAACLLAMFMFAPLTFALEPMLPDNPLQGARIFEQKGCIKCHAIHSEGGKTAPDLGSEQFQGGFLELARLMWNHFPKMKSAILSRGGQVPTFTRSEMEDLFAYLFYVPHMGESGDEKRGKELITKKGCLKCHNEETGGKADAPGFSNMVFYGSPLYLAEAMWNHGPEMQRHMKKSGVERPHIEGDEMTDMAVYLQKVSAGGFRERIYMQPGNPKVGEKVFRSKRCSDCHAVNDEKKQFGSAPDLSRSDEFSSITQIAGMMWNHGGEMAALMEKRGIPWPRFSGAEMPDLIAYLYFLKFSEPPGEIEKGKAVFRSKNCMSCHDPLEQDNRTDVHRIPSVESPLTMVMSMWNHAPRMDSLMTDAAISWPTFESKEMNDLYAFLRMITVDKDEK